MERHLGFAVKIVTICEKKKSSWKRFFINLVQHKKFCVWNQRLQQMHREENTPFDQDVIVLQAKAIKVAHSRALLVCTAASAAQFLIISNRLIAHHLYLSSTWLHPDNNNTYLQVQKQCEAIRGCRCCQPYQPFSSVQETANRCEQTADATIQPKLKLTFWLLSHMLPVILINVWTTKSHDEKWKCDSGALSELLSTDFLQRLWTFFSLSD